MLNMDLKIALIKNYGTQIAAARRLKISDTKLSLLVRGHDEPTERERRVLKQALGVDYFAPAGEGPQAA